MKKETKRLKISTRGASRPSRRFLAFVSVFVFIFVLIYSTSANLLNIRPSTTAETKMKMETKAEEPASEAQSVPRICVFTRFISVFTFVLIYSTSANLLNIGR